MRILTSLVRKELRDARGFLLLAGALLVALTVGAKLAFGSDYDAHMRVEWVTPLAIATVAVVLAAESIGRDAASGVEELWQRLPVDRALVWAGKLVAVALGTAVFAGFEAALETLLRAVEPATRRPVPMFPEIVGLLGLPCLSVLAVATVLRRSLPAALVGVALVIAPPLVGEELEGRAKVLLLLSVDRWSPAQLAWVATGAFALASCAAFRAHGWRFLPARRAGSAAAGLALVLGTTLGVSVAEAPARAAYGPFHPEARIVQAALSPDGRFLAAGVTRSLHLRNPWGTTREVHLPRVWILDRERGLWNDLPDDEWRGLSHPWLDYYGWDRSPWSADGLLATVTAKTETDCWELLDPRTGRAAWSSEASAGWDIQNQRMGAPAQWYDRKRIGREEEVVWRGRGITRRFPEDALVGVSPIPGICFERRDSDILKVDLADGSETTLARDAATWVDAQVSPDGRWIAHRATDGTRVIDLRWGESVVFAGAVVRWSERPGRIALVRGPWPSDRLALVLADGSLRDVCGHGYEKDAWLEDGDDALIHYTVYGTTIERRDLDGNVLEVLYPR